MNAKTTNKKRSNDSNNATKRKAVYGNAIFSITIDQSKILDSNLECVLSSRRYPRKKRKYSANRELYSRRNYLNEETNEIDMLNLVFDKRNSSNNHKSRRTRHSSPKNYKREMHKILSRAINENLEKYPAGISCHIINQIILDNDFLVEDVQK